MKKIKFLGDIHGNFPVAINICNNYPDHEIIVVGDFGMDEKSRNRKFPNNLKFFRGNHDHPTYSIQHPNYLFDYGMYEDDIFILAGGDSIDKQYRKAGIDWWPDEQLNYTTMQNALEYYKQKKPKILVCHEAPFRYHYQLRNAAVTAKPYLSQFGDPKGNSTAFLLDDMIDAHIPNHIIHGHWHVSLKMKDNECTIHSLNINELMDCP